MSAQLVWTLLFFACIAGSISGALYKPLDPKVESKNFSLFLTWLPNPENPQDVMYDVLYKVVAFKHWKRIQACTNVTFLRCDLTCTFMKEFSLNHIVQVRTVSHLLGSSRGVKLENLSYIVSVEPDPPVLHIKEGENNVSITANVELPACFLPFLLSYLSYSVKITGPTQKEVYKIKLPPTTHLMTSSITIKTHGYKGEYCFAAKTLYEMTTKKESKLSNPVCKNFTQKTEEHQTPLLIGMLFAPILIFVVIICYIIFKRTTQQIKKPKVLDFTNKSSSEASSVLISSPENCHLITICDKKDVMTSTALGLYNKNDDSTNDYASDRGYTQRPAMQDIKNNVSQNRDLICPEYSSSTNSSDKSSSGFKCETTSESSTGISMTLNNLQINNDLKENRTVSGEMETSSTNASEHNLFSSLCILDTTSMENVPFDSLCIGSNDHRETSDDESSNQYLPYSEESLEKRTTDTTDWEISNSYRTSKDGNTQNNWKSGYEQRTMLRGC